MIVRLKGRQISNLALRQMFQFYDSPIKRIIGFLGNTGRTTFQFYDSPIKSSPELCKLIGNSSKFQFYDSPIKSLTWTN